MASQQQTLQGNLPPIRAEDILVQVVTIPGEKLENEQIAGSNELPVQNNSTEEDIVLEGEMVPDQQSQNDQIVNPIELPVQSNDRNRRNRRNRHNRRMVVHVSKRYPCRKHNCRKSFDQPSSEMKHQVVHARPYNYFCMGCYTIFPNEKNKLVHVRKCPHKQYECYICKAPDKKCFVTNQLANLLKHFESIHM